MSGTWCSADRWTCPTCQETTIIDSGNDDAVALAIRLAQTQHAERHAPEPWRQIADGARHGAAALDVLRIAADGAR